MRHFHIQRTEEDADEAGRVIVRVEDRSATSDATESTPWTCDPCGSTNTVDRGNCAFCGKAR